MTSYRKVPWKRNIRVIPADIAEKIRITPAGVGLVPVCIKVITAKELSENKYQHLGIILKNGAPSFPTAVVPPESSGVFSHRNVNGWELKRTDLPMVKKNIYLGQRPIFGDYSNGSFPLWQEREVYQVEEFPPTDYQIVIDLIKVSAVEFTFKFQLDCILNKSSPDFSDMILYCINMLQENVGVCGVDRSDKTREEYIATIMVDWEIFPPGSVDRFLAKATARAGGASSEAGKVVDERIRAFRTLVPKSYVLGTGGFNKYVGAIMADGVVVFENMRYGNALYVLYANWEDVSQRSRIDLIKGTSGEYERIPHVDGWQEQFRIAVRRGRPRK